MEESKVQKASIILIMSLFIQLLTNNPCQGGFFHKLYVQSTFTNISLPLHEVHLAESRP